MAAAVFDLVNEYAVDQGSQFAVDFSLKINGVARNIGTPIAYSVRGQIRENFETATIIATFVCSVTDAANGKFRISLTPAVTKLLVPGKYLYDIEIFQSGNDDVICERVIKGKVEITPEITK